MTCSNVLFRMLPSIGACVFFFAPVLTTGQISSTPAVELDGVSVVPPAIIIGFVGGFVRHDDPVRGEVQLAARLRKEYPTGVDVETFESYRGEKAHQKILELLDTNHTGSLTTEEKKNARIIVYGHSWGGAETVNLARALERDGIRVLLTLQVDSVSKRGSNDTLIPANVAQAVNYYQSNGLLHGHRKIRAADPTHTQIIGNFRFDYKKSSLKCSDYPWYNRIFVKAHTQIECDPIVWNQVESLIRSNLPPQPAQSTSVEVPLLI